MNDNLLKVLLGWMQDFFAGMQEWFGRGSFEKMSRHWIVWVIVLIVLGFLIDKIVYFFRFRPDRRVKEAVNSFRSVMNGKEEEEEIKDEVNQYGYVSYKEEPPVQEEEEYTWGTEEDKGNSMPPAAGSEPSEPSLQGKIHDQELNPRPDGPVPIGIYHGPRQNVPFGVYSKPNPGKESPPPVPEETEKEKPGEESFELENMRDLSQPPDEEPGTVQITEQRE